MAITKVKTWLRVKREVIDPMAKARKILLYYTTKAQTRNAIKIIEAVADSVTSIGLETDRKLEEHNIGYQKVFHNAKINPIGQANELNDMKITEFISNTSDVTNDTAIRFYNRILKQTIPFIEAYYFVS